MLYIAYYSKTLTYESSSYVKRVAHLHAIFCNLLMNPVLLSGLDKVSKLVKNTEREGKHRFLT